MKRAATQLFKRQSKNRAFFSNFYFDLRPPGQTPGQIQRSGNPTPGAARMCKSPAVAGGGGGWSGLKLTHTLISHPFRDVLGLIPFPKAVKYSFDSYFDVLSDNASKVEQKVKYKSDLGITGSCLQWNMSRCAVTKGTDVLKSVMLTDLAFLSISGFS